MGRGGRRTNLFRGPNAVRSGLLTALSIVTVSGSAAVSGAVLAQKFGRSAQTDGFLAAYGIYLLLVIVANAFRMVVLPELTRAATSGHLAHETRAYLSAFLVLALPPSAAVIAWSRPLGAAITGNLPAEAADLAARALVWLVPAAFAQLLCSLAASALAARDSYGVAAFAYAAGAVAGLGVFLLLADEHGLVALAWGIALNGAITFGIPLLVLAARRDLVGEGPRSLRLGVRAWRLLQGAAVPVAGQALYLIALRLAADLGVGVVTSFSYAYMIAAALVAASASSLSLISSVPLTRRGLDAESGAAHIVHCSWVCLAAIVAAAGVFTLVGGHLVAWVLGIAYSGEVGRELVRLVLYLAPWMVATVASIFTFPLLFVMQRPGVLLPLALAVLGLHLPLALGLRNLFGLQGIAVALALSTLAVLIVMLASLSRRMLVLCALGLGRLTLIQTVIGVLSFGAVSLFVSGIPAALGGLTLYLLLLAVVRPHQLRDAWAYVRALHRE